MRFLRQSMIGLFLTAATFGLLIYAVYMVSSAVQDRIASERPDPPQRERAFAVHLISAELGQETPVLETFGEIISRRTLELRAAVEGRVVTLAPEFQDGGQVRKGDVLVTIDPADKQSAFDRLAADLADAQAEVRDAERGLELARLEEIAAQDQVALRERALARQLDLSDRGVGSATSVEAAELAAAAARAVVLARRQAVTQAEARIDTSETRLTRAEIALAEADRDLQDTTVEAPFDGTISDPDAVEGGLIAINERLADLIDPNDLEVAFRVSTAQYARLLDEEGKLIDAPVVASLEVLGSDLQAQGRISRVSASAGEGQTGRLVFARLTSAIGFRPGDFVSVSVSEPNLDQVARLPSSALSASGEVLVLTADDRLEAVQVDLVRRQGDEILVRGDLEGREVVRERSPLLGAGILVRPIRPAEQDSASSAEEHTMIELSPERRAELIASIEENKQLPEVAKARFLAQLSEPSISQTAVARIEKRVGG